MEDRPPLEPRLPLTAALTAWYAQAFDGSCSERPAVGARFVAFSLFRFYLILFL